MTNSTHRYFIVHKPYNMVSQFVSTHQVKLLGNLNFNFPEGTHAIGRLDNNSEGLLILTTNKKITRLLFQGKVPHKRTYLVQINNTLSQEKLTQLQTGTSIRIMGGGMYTTPACEVKIIENPEVEFGIIPAEKKYGTSTWITITLTEGKFHQVRKMVYSINHRCKRLIRVSIENILLGNLPAGEIREMNEADFFKQLNIENVP